MKLLITREEIIKGLQKASSLTSQKNRNHFFKGGVVKMGK